MNKKLILVSAIAASVALAGCNKKEEESKPAPLETTLQKVSYGIGHNISSNFKKQEIVLDMKAFERGMTDGAAGKEPVLDQQTIMTAMQEFQKELMEKQMAAQKQLSETNKTEADKFLAENKAKEGVTTTDSGLQYKVLTKGTGEKHPTPDDTVVVHYRGTLLNGEEFDSSYKRNEPATFSVSSVIPGWTEALQLMVVGDKFELVIPSDLAYGDGGAGQKIGPNAALKFEVELLDIKGSNERLDESKASSAGSAQKSKLDGKTLKK